MKKTEYRFRPDLYVKPQAPVHVPDIPVPAKPIVVSESVTFLLNCVMCFEVSAVLFSGSSYCKKCYLEKIRTGK